MQTLTGHTSPETAYVVTDYPYGYKLRTQIRYWIEHKPKHGFRFMSQTLNPKNGRWNKPKASTYTDVMVMVQGDDGHIRYAALGIYEKPEKIDAYEQRFADAFTDEHRKAIRFLRAANEASKHLKWTIVERTDHVPVQTPQEQAQIISRVIAHEYRKLA